MKGVSNIIAAVLLVGISVTMAAMYSSWAPGFSENVTGNVVDQTNNDITCNNAGLAIKDPVYDRSLNATILEIHNSGTIRFTDKIDVAVVNTSIINQTAIEGLDVEQSSSMRLYSKHSPELIFASSVECPDLEVERRQIRVRD